jgi:hypothetical protein
MISLKKYLNAKVSAVRMSLCKIKVAYQEIEIGMIYQQHISKTNSRTEADLS